MKKLWTLIGVAVLALALGACGGGGDEGGGGGNETATTGPITIDLWHLETVANQTTLDGLIDRFNASQDEVRVRPSYQGNASELVLKVLTSLRSGDVPALVELVEADAQVMVDSGGITPVQEFIDEEGYDLSDYDEKAVGYYTVDGELQALPLAISVPMLFYNKVPFREVGLDPEKPPTTLDDVRAYSEKLYKVDGSGNVVRSGIAIEVSPWWVEILLGEHGDLFANNDNGRSGRATEAVFNGETGQAIFRWWDEMIDRGLAFNVGRNPAGADALLAVASGRAAMAPSSSQALRSVMDVLESGLEGVELGVGPFPFVAGGDGKPGVGSRGLWIMNKRSEEEQRAAWTFSKWLAEPEQQAEFFAGSGYLPVRISAYDLDASKQVLVKYPQYQAPIDEFVGAPATPAKLGALLGPFNQVREIVAQALEEMLLGGKDPAEALDDAAARITDEIQEYNGRVGE